MVRGGGGEGGAARGRAEAARAGTFADLVLFAALPRKPKASELLYYFFHILLKIAKITFENFHIG